MLRVFFKEMNMKQTLLNIQCEIKNAVTSSTKHLALFDKALGHIPPL